MPSFSDSLRITANKNGWDFEMRNCGVDEDNLTTWELKYTNRYTGEVWSKLEDGQLYYLRQMITEADPTTLITVLGTTDDDNPARVIFLAEEGEKLDFEENAQCKFNYILRP